MAKSNVRIISWLCAESETLNFDYDYVDRLSHVTGAYAQSWTYDAIGNILAGDGVDAATFAYNDPAHKHAVTQGSTSYTYDPNGNMHTRGSDLFNYDHENRLTSATVGSVATTYVYNADGQRVQKVAGGVTTYYVGNWYEVTGSTATKYYYFGSQRVAMRQSDQVTYIHGDQLGSTNATSGANPSKQWYYAFGVVRATDGVVLTDYTYTGQKADSDGLMFYNARYYDASLGRFVQPDSIIPNMYDPQSLNRYAYVRNNPVKYSDPTGHRECDDFNPCSEEEHAQVEDLRNSLLDRVSEYGVEVAGKFKISELSEIVYVMDAFGSFIGPDNFKTLLRNGAAYGSPKDHLTFDRNSSNPGDWLASIGTINILESAFNPATYGWSPQLYASEDAGKWYMGHEIGHVLVDGLRMNGVDLADLYRDQVPAGLLHPDGPPNEEVATAIALGALQSTGMNVGVNYTGQRSQGLRDFVNTTAAANLRSFRRGSRW